MVYGLTSIEIFLESGANKTNLPVPGVREQQWATKHSANKVKRKG